MAQTRTPKAQLDTTLVDTTTTQSVSGKNLATGNTFPTFNQNTTGSAATLTTARTIQTTLGSTTAASFDGSANITPGVTGTLPVPNGGTGSTTLTGVIKGTGTSALIAATAGTDYSTPSVSETVTAAKSFNSGTLKLNGASAGTTTLNAPASAGTLTITTPSVSDTLVGLAATQVLTNKTINDTTSTVGTVTLMNAYKFRVYRTAAANTGSAAFALITMDTKAYDTGSNYSTSTGLFTAPVAGFYQFNGRASTTTSGRIVITLYKNGSEAARGSDVTVASGVAGSTVADMLSLNAGDTVGLYAYGDTTRALDVTVPTATVYLSGYLVTRT